MAKRVPSRTTRRAKRPPTVLLEIELPELSNETAAALADVLVQLYHRFEATYHGQILSHHADQILPPEKPASGYLHHGTKDPF